MILLFLLGAAGYLSIGGVVYGYLNHSWLTLFKDDEMLAVVMVLIWPFFFAGMILRKGMHLPILIGEQAGARRLARLEREREARREQARLLRQYEEEVEKLLE